MLACNGVKQDCLSQGGFNGVPHGVSGESLLLAIQSHVCRTMRTLRYNGKASVSSLRFPASQVASMSDSHPATNQSFYDRISHAYDLISDAGEHKARERGEQALSVMEGERVLEIGFGTGNTMIHLATAVGESGCVSGIDVSTGMLAVATKKLAAKGFSERVDLCVGDARKLPYKDNSFDAVFASFTLELFPLEDIPEVLSEVARVLKPGGRIGVVSMATVKEGQMPSELEKTYIWMHEHFPHIVDCQPIDVVQLVSDAGLNVQQEIEMTIWSMPVRCVVATVG